MSAHAFLDDPHYQLLLALARKWHLSDATALNLCVDFAPPGIAPAPCLGSARHRIKLTSGRPGAGAHHSRRLQPAVRTGGLYRAAIVYTAQRLEQVEEALLHRKWVAKGALRPVEEGQPALQVQCPPFFTGPARARFVALLEGLHDPTVLLDTPWAAYIVGRGKLQKAALRSVPVNDQALTHYRAVIDSLDDYMSDWLTDPKYAALGPGPGIRVLPRNFDQLIWWLAHFPETASPDCPYHVARRDAEEGRYSMIACTQPLTRRQQKAMKAQ